MYRDAAAKTASIPHSLCLDFKEWGACSISTIKYADIKTANVSKVYILPSWL